MRQDRSITSQEKKARIAAILKDSPAISTNALVKKVGCSWDFAQKTRHELGIDAPFRETTNGRLYPTGGECPAGSAVKRRQVTADSLEALRHLAQHLGAYPGTLHALLQIKRVLAAFHTASKSPVPFADLWESFLKTWKANGRS